MALNLVIAAIIYRNTAYEVCFFHHVRHALYEVRVLKTKHTATAALQHVAKQLYQAAR